MPDSIPMFKSDLREAIAESVSVLVADLMTGEILEASPPLEVMFGYAVRGELVGTFIDQLVPEDLRDRHAEHRRAYAANPRARFVRGGIPQLFGRKKDGTTFRVEITLYPRIISGRKCVVAAVFDMS